MTRMTGQDCAVMSVCFLPIHSGHKFVGRTSRGYTGRRSHRISAVRALIFLARRIQPFLSLVDRESNLLTDKYTYILPPWEDQCEWHRMTRMTGPDCAVMNNLINIHTCIHIHTNNIQYQGTS